MSEQLPEIYNDIQKLKAKLDKYHDDMSGVSFGKNTIFGVGVDIIHFSDYTAAALDALGDLAGIMQSYYQED